MAESCSLSPRLPTIKNANNRSSVMVGCPNCERVFKNQHGLHTHDAMVHDGELSVSSRECVKCGETFRPPPQNREARHCSMECRKRRVEIECSHCGEPFERRPSKSHQEYCSRECVAKARRNRVKITCEQCGVELVVIKAKENRRFCSQECHGEWQSENRAGENHPCWQGGSPDFYGPNWRQQKEKARKRDGNQCQVCGVTADKLGKQPDVHHIIPIKRFESTAEANELSNLICLCRSCHRRWEGIPLRPMVS